MPSDPIGPPIDSVRAVRLLRAKVAELEADVKDVLARDPSNTLAYLTADIALIAGLLADHLADSERHFD